MVGIIFWLMILINLRIRPRSLPRLLLGLLSRLLSVYHDLLLPTLFVFIVRPAVHLSATALLLSTKLLLYKLVQDILGVVNCVLALVQITCFTVIASEEVPVESGLALLSVAGLMVRHVELSHDRFVVSIYARIMYLITDGVLAFSGLPEMTLQMQVPVIELYVSLRQMTDTFILIASRTQIMHRFKFFRRLHDVAMVRYQWVIV